MSNEKLLAYRLFNYSRSLVRGPSSFLLKTPSEALLNHPARRCAYGHAGQRLSESARFQARLQKPVSTFNGASY